MTPLAQIIAARIAAYGPMRMDEYMQLCLLHPDHGYYTTREPFGQSGDFITAPEISQMFGEVLAAAIAQAWMDQGRPRGAILAEPGPGRGTLMADMLRVLRKVPGWDAQIVLVEASPRLREIQKSTIQKEYSGDVHHVDTVAELPQAPLFLVANEFFDALPIRQFRRGADGWAEVMVGLQENRLALILGPPAPLPRKAPVGSIWEIREPARPVATGIATRIARHGGGAIFVDYGDWDGQGDSFQALKDGRPDDPLAAPGLADLTAHVDFAPIAASGHATGVQVSRMVTQGALLGALGVGARAAALAGARPDQAEAIAAALHRLTDPGEMGHLFKALAFWPAGAPAIAGFTLSGAQ